MRAMTSLVSFSALGHASAFLVPGHIVRGGTRGSAPLRFTSRGYLTSTGMVALRRSAMARVSTVKMSDTTTTAVAGKAQPKAVPAGELTELARLEIRTGKILEISRHPEVDGLYVEKIDVGGGPEAGPRTIVSSLVNYCSEEYLLEREVVVLCNLKPANMKGIISAGMLLCSNNEDHTKVEPLSPPSGVPPGELVTFEGHASSPVEAGNRAVKAWKRVSKTLEVNEDKVAMFTGETLPAQFMTSKGPITSSLPGSIS